MSRRVEPAVTSLTRTSRAEHVTDLHLFDVPAPAPVRVKLSAGARLTARNNATLAAGRHPATRLELHAGDHACGGCAHAIQINGGNRTYWKCERAGITHGAATDIRISWPACTAWTDRARLVDCPTCNGKGKIVNPDRDPKSATYLRCPTCKWRGVVIEAGT